MSDSFDAAQVSSDDKLWALLCYVLFPPLVPIVILLFMQDKKNRPFIRAHNAQALVMGILGILLTVFVGWTVFLSCLPLALWIFLIYWGIQGYQGKYVTIPVVTSFCKNQGWA